MGATGICDIYTSLLYELTLLELVEGRRMKVDFFSR